MITANKYTAEKPPRDNSGSKRSLYKLKRMSMHYRLKSIMLQNLPISYAFEHFPNFLPKYNACFYAFQIIMHYAIIFVTFFYVKCHIKSLLRLLK